MARLAAGPAPSSGLAAGVTFTLGFLTPGGDAGWIAKMGVPASVILVGGFLLLFAGLMAFISLLPVAGIGSEAPLGRRFFMLVTGIGCLMSIRAAHSYLASPGAVMENLIPLVFALLSSVIIVLLQRPVSAILSQVIDREAMTVAWRPAVLALLSGTAIFVLQVLLVS